MPIARWAFDIRQPLLLEHIEPLVTSLTADNGPNIVPVTNLLNFLPKIECDRILRFRAEDDMRRALIGRLMIHAFFAAHHGCHWEELVFSRSETNKPILLKPDHLRNISFNISHHGNWVLLVGDTSVESTLRLGIDVMDFQKQVPEESFDTFLRCFQDQFTKGELAFMNSAPLDQDASSRSDDQFRRFYRLWCLKESVVKTLGVGIDFNLQSFEFVIQNEEEVLEPTLSTRMDVYVPSDLLPREGWFFEEALLDQDHCYAIAALTDTPESVEQGSVMDGSVITRLDWKELLKDAVPYPFS
ncbi:4'-phosphopantetheinyl transferase superfamily [Gamsiella multidivaricata]|uniref:4'-phosphopantetheinyl transferase superfamily n=1 Tax=Gamsiella multidivaricata TaxID=101098 RepID=UPI00221E61D5|nr:4'-phosphopantetheinyl transferase superfamily [Gamsiella multidivaricata]KAI7826092.1 4'-phosphopantetheinyl transferase superfamily [Gamsiella multidivaricata]